MKQISKAVLVILSLSGFALMGLTGCSSPPPVKQQAYAQLKNQRVYEYELPVVWKALEASLKNHKIVNRDPEEVDPIEFKKLSERTLETDWIFGQSRDKYVEYKVNDSPRKKYLQTRFKYDIAAKSVLGGTEVTVKTTEEIERLNSDGSSDGYESVNSNDTSRPNEILEKINTSLLSAAP